MSQLDDVLRELADIKRELAEIRKGTVYVPQPFAVPTPYPVYPYPANPWRPFVPLQPYWQAPVYGPAPQVTTTYQCANALAPSSDVVQS